MLSEVKLETDIPTPTLTPVSKTSPQNQFTLEDITKHNQTQKLNTKECTPVLPKFGWESIAGEKDSIPYIIRDSESYVAWIIYENKIIKKFTPYLSNVVLACITEDLKKMSEVEAAMFNEINLQHCDGNLVGKEFRFMAGEPMLSLEDVKKSLNFFLTCYNVICLSKISNNLFGILKISGENEVAFVWSKNTMLVPLFYFEGQSEYLDSKSIVLTDKWQIRYMRFCCIAQRIGQVYYDATPMKVVDFEYIRCLFPENTPVEYSWPKDFNLNILSSSFLSETTHLTKCSQSSKQMDTITDVTNFTQSSENSTTPRSGNDQSRIPNSARSQLTNMMLAKPVNNQMIKKAETTKSVLSHCNNFQLGIGENNQSGLKRSIAEYNEAQKRFRCESSSIKSPLKVTETTDQFASTQRLQSTVLYETDGVTISTISEKPNANQNLSSTQQKQRALITTSFRTNPRVVPHYGQKENSSITPTSNQMVIHALQPSNVAQSYRHLNRGAPPPCYPVLSNLYRETPLQFPSNQMQNSALAGSSEYPFSYSGWNGTRCSVYPSNIPSTFYRQQNTGTYNPGVMRPNSQYVNQNQPLSNSLPINTALYEQINTYFYKNVLSKPKGSLINLNALTEIFMNLCGISDPKHVRLKSWISKTFADMCHKAGYL